MEVKTKGLNAKEMSNKVTNSIEVSMLRQKQQELSFAIQQLINNFILETDIQDIDVDIQVVHVMGRTPYVLVNVETIIK